MTASPEVSRRDFLKVSGGAGAGLVLSFYLPACTRASMAESVGSFEPNGWIRIGTDDKITFFVSESEMGQGVMTSLPMILAEELEADWTNVSAQHALADRSRYGNQGTGGSTSIRTNYDKLRKAGATAREMLISAAADTWGVDRATLRAENGAVVHAASGRSLSYGKLADKASTLSPPDDPPLKDPKDFKIIGKPMKRLDTPLKVDGSAIYGIDVKVPGMLIAQIVHPPVFGGKAKSFDASKALAVSGVRHVVEVPTGIAIVADSFWAAKKGRDALQVTWDNGKYGELTSDQITAECRRLVNGGAEARDKGNATRAIAGAAKKIDAVYEVPYLAHATMEPMNCTADVRSDGCDIWAPTQAPTGTQSVAAEITGLPAEKITVHTTYMGGGFGRRSETDFVKDAVHTSKAVGKPVKVIWTREDDMRGGWYRPTAYNTFSGAVDKNGDPVAWVHKIASPSILEGKGFLRGPIDRAAVEGAANIPYGIPNIHVTWAKPDLPITTHWWRSVGSSQNAFVTESFFDELAALGGKDPFELRRKFLTDKPRHRRVLETAAREAGWGTPLPNGKARGIAVHESFGSFVAQVAEVSLRDDGSVRVHRVVCAVDCGHVVNPDTIVAQMESGIVYGMSAALYGKITIDNGRAVEGNFDKYPVIRIDEMPRVETHIVTSGDALGGIGEPGLPPVAPAICNAIYALTGKRIRTLPIGKLA
ncbi:MAG: molybdopterin cofactor-binding domain-containing protein [Gemmatimonadales bacterium]